MRTLLFAIALACAASARQLQQSSPGAVVKDCTSPAAWNFTKCTRSSSSYSSSSASPSPSPTRSPSPSPRSVPPLTNSSGPTIKDGSWVSLATATPLGITTLQRNSTATNSTSSRNPFINPDLPLVRSTQGYVSGGSGIGFRTGGAQDVENFRENIKQGLLPLPTDVTFEGVVKDYYFDTSSKDNLQNCTELFCPVYSAATSGDPLVVSAFSEKPRNATELYLAVGLDSGLQAADVKRKPLNLVILLDYSGSMSSSFDRYYYDQFGERKELTQDEANQSKMDVAKEAVTGILDLLAPEDRVSIVLFSTNACDPLSLTPVNCLDVNATKSDFLKDVSATDSTNMQAGFDLATQQLTNCSECMAAGLDNAENRIIMITDAQPNTGDWSEEGLLDIMSSNADRNIFATIIGVGLDFNTELIEGISKVKGANYYSIHTPGEFQRRLVTDFDYAVNPLVFDLELSIDPDSLQGPNETQGWRILHVYGSPNPNDTAYAALGGNGTVSRVNTLFPSPKTEEGVKGGVVLLRMGAPVDGPNAVPLGLQVTYSDRKGEQHASQRTVALPQQVLGGTQGYYQSTGVRKAVLLSRYTDLVRNWLIDEWPKINGTGNRTVIVPQSLCRAFPSEFCLAVQANETYGVTQAAEGCQLESWIVPDGCILPTPVPVIIELNQWERQSQNLTGHVPPPAKTSMQEFLPYIESEIQALGDSSLNQEVEILNKIIAA